VPCRSRTARRHRGPPAIIIRPRLTIDRAIDLFLGDLSRRGATARTRPTYVRLLDKFCNRPAGDYDVSKITTDDSGRGLDTFARRARHAGARGVGAPLVHEVAGHRREGCAQPHRSIAAHEADHRGRPRRRHGANGGGRTDVARRARLVGADRARDYTDARRRAVALRLRDYHRLRGRLRFHDKGGKLIWKPVPAELRSLLEAAIADGAIVEADDYFVAPESYLSRRGTRDDRVIWRLRRVADRAGGDAHIHALRAAFAVFYLERHPGDVESPKEPMGDRSIATTQVCLRRPDRQRAMERVRDRSWGDLSLGQALVDRRANRRASSPIVSLVADEFVAQPHGRARYEEHVRELGSWWVVRKGRSRKRVGGIRFRVRPPQMVGTLRCEIGDRARGEVVSQSFRSFHGAGRHRPRSLRTLGWSP
jgi:hypothetical protein